jgi:hypothetical protein
MIYRTLSNKKMRERRAIPALLAIPPNPAHYLNISPTPAFQQFSFWQKRRQSGMDAGIQSHGR